MNPFSPLTLSEFSILGMHGTRDMRLAIRDDRFVLVGANGLGKSTFLNVMYLVLSGQWHKLLDFNFDRIDLNISGQEFSISRSGLEAGDLENLEGSLPTSIRRRIAELDTGGQLTEFVNAPERNMPRFSRSLGMSTLATARLQAEIKRLFELNPDLFVNRVSKERQRLRDVLGNLQILYLPTYRRIEKELKIIVPDIEERLSRYNETSSSRLNQARRRDAFFVELVEFGMEDVDARISDILQQLEGFARRELNALAGEYLRDVVRGQARDFNIDLISEIDEPRLVKLLSRVEENTLTEQDKRLLREAILRLRGNQEAASDDRDHYVAHFISKLADKVIQLEGREKLITEFVRMCNKYLVDKTVNFSDTDYRISVTADGSTQIALADLSSGEKQVVSLFAHVLLGEDRKYVILIDEPELSLSVDWQEALLPDLLQTGRCALLGAVTHSPFIFANGLDSYAIDMRSCTTVR